MKIRYLGTAAAEGVPAIFCQCETCVKSRKLGGKNIRTRSQAIIDDKILIDLPADTYMHSILHGIDLTYIKTCIITHNHGDHLYPTEICYRRQGYFAQYNEDIPFDIYGSGPSYKMISKKLSDSGNDEHHFATPHEIKPFSPFEAEGYKITPLKAFHDAKCDPVIYIIEKDGKAMLYGHDSGLFPDETWDYLKTWRGRFDLVSLDCTFATREGMFGGHMSLDGNVIVSERLKEMGLADDNTVVVANHFTHNGGATYDETKAKADKLGIITSYDGLVIEF